MTAAEPSGEKRYTPSIIRFCDPDDDDHYTSDCSSSDDEEDGQAADESRQEDAPRSTTGVTRADRETVPRASIASFFVDDDSVLVSEEHMDSSVIDLPLVTALPCDFSFIQPFTEHDNVHRFVSAEPSSQADARERTLPSSSIKNKNKKELPVVMAAGTDDDKRQKARRTSWIYTLFSRRQSNHYTALHF